MSDDPRFDLDWPPDSPPDARPDQLRNLMRRYTSAPQPRRPPAPDPFDERDSVRHLEGERPGIGNQGLTLADLDDNVTTFWDYGFPNAEFSHADPADDTVDFWTLNHHANLHLDVRDDAGSPGGHSIRVTPGASVGVATLVSAQCPIADTFPQTCLLAVTAQAGSVPAGRLSISAEAEWFDENGNSTAVGPVDAPWDVVLANGEYAYHVFRLGWVFGAFPVSFVKVSFVITSSGTSSNPVDILSAARSSAKPADLLIDDGSSSGGGSVTPTPLPGRVIWPSGGDDCPAIQALFDTVPEGTTIYFPGDEYQLSCPLTQAKDNIRLVGKGGTFNPTHDGVTKWVWTGSAGSDPMLTWGKPEPGLSGDDPDSVIVGGEITGILFDGQNDVPGVRVVKARYLWFHNCSVTLNDDYGVWFGGAIKADVDVWNQTLNCHVEQLQIYEQNSANGFVIASQTGGAGPGGGSGVAHTNYVNNLIVGVEDGIGIKIENCDDWRFGPLWNVGVSGTGTSIDLEGGNFVDGNMISSFGLFIGGYTQSNPIVLHGDGYTWPAYEHLFLGHSEVDHSGPMFAADKGAMPSYLTTGGLHNLRDDIRYGTPPIIEEWVGGVSASGQAGSLGWLFAFTGGAGTFNPIGAVSGRPGVWRLTTAAAGGALGYTMLQGGWHPDDEFWLQWILELNTSDGNTMARFGFCDPGTVANDPPTDGMYIEKKLADASWFGVCRSGGAESRTAALQATAGFTWLLGRIRRLNSTTIGFNIGESVDHVDDARLTTNIPTVGMVPFAQIKTNTGATRAIDLDTTLIQARNLNRV